MLHHLQELKNVELKIPWIKDYQCCLEDLFAIQLGTVFWNLPDFLTLQGNPSRDSSVGIATRYGLDGPGIESPWGRNCPHPSIPALGPTQPPIQWVPGLSRG
jgi:hypothetical protein